VTRHPLTTGSVRLRGPVDIALMHTAYKLLNTVFGVIWKTKPCYISVMFIHIISPLAKFIHRLQLEINQRLNGTPERNRTVTLSIYNLVN
jgi:hypothetical protein